MTGCNVIKNYADAVNYFYNHIDYERIHLINSQENDFKLDRTIQLLKELDNPHRKIRTVHIAGTKGKGSTAAMLVAGLRACSLKVGAFTSPHLVDIRERITVNSELIAKDDFTEITRKLAGIAGDLGIDNKLHFFEIITVMAFEHFHKQSVDIAVIETGLGGRLDCTNVIVPEVSAITQISYDHMNLLGNTLPEIAGEKAGIIKRGVPVISAPQEVKVAEVLREYADRAGSEIRILGDDLEFSCWVGKRDRLGVYASLNLESQIDDIYNNIEVPLAGLHQAYNCGLVLAVFDILRKGGSFGGRCLREPDRFLRGMSGTSLAGRMELVCERPRILIDGAHNAASVAAVMDCVGLGCGKEQLVVIFGCAKSKDVGNMIGSVLQVCDKIIFTRAADNPRAISPELLKQEFMKIADVDNNMCIIAESLCDAMDMAESILTNTDDGLICVTGSFYLVGEAKKRVSERIFQQKQGD